MTGLTLSPLSIKNATYITSIRPRYRPIHKSAAILNAIAPSVGSTAPEIKTAGLIVIGDEILKGQVLDTNSHYISKVLYGLGVKVRRITVVGDCENEIIKEIRDSSPKFTFVITSGGIGPTHDDITFEAIAKAFNEPLVPHPELVKICSNFYKTKDLNAPALKLAHIPKSARLTFGYDKVKKRRMPYPNVAVNNVYIFPGVPQLLEKSFSAVSDNLFGGGCTTFYLREVYVTADETEIANYLNCVVQEFPHVTFGSYPKFVHNYYRVRLTIESQIEDDLILAHERLILTVPKEYIIEYDKAPLDDAYAKVIKLTDTRLGKNIQQAVSKVEEFCQNYKSEEICLYFDGEKESTAILHLYYACLKKFNIDTNILAVFVNQNPSTEIEDYIKDTEARYNLKIVTLRGEVLSCIESYVSQHMEIKAIIVGTTLDVDKIDHSQFSTACPATKLFQPCETWTSSEIWDFIRLLYLPYCNLYDNK